MFCIHVKNYILNNFILKKKIVSVIFTSKRTRHLLQNYVCDKKDSRYQYIDNYKSHQRLVGIENTIPQSTVKEFEFKKDILGQVIEMPL